ncbi:MAG TPA: acyl-CoA dehydrogenase family protein [Acidimicrobiales bacterium]|nr:acyl-CoA dehydrogenase family protein [Acidimicrobiales bacterium]
MEDVDSFRLRAKDWLAANMPRRSGRREMTQDERVARNRELQRTLFDGGFAGIVFPSEYGGQGLSPRHQRAFTEESAGYEMPLLFNVPTLGILAPTLLEFGNEEQKLRHLPAILRGDELWVQFLSEPSGGSDLAGCITRATQDGDVWVLNGSKIWSSGAHYCDYAMCLARTNWDVPKHRGLTMFIVKIHQPGIQIDQIRQVNGASEFCQEFFDDVHIPAADVIGAVNDGWTVASRLLFHERNSVGGSSPYVSGGGAEGSSGGRLPGNAWLARETGASEDPYARELVAESHILDVVHAQLADRIGAGIRSGAFPGTAGAIVRLFAGQKTERQTDINMEIAGAAFAASPPGSAVNDYADQFLARQGGSLGGGSTEMARNIISERVLGMPREYAADRDIPFNQVRRNS